MNLLRGKLSTVLSPSFMSGTVSVLTAIGLVTAVLTPYLYRGSYLERYGATVRDYPGGWSESYGAILAQLDSSEAVATISTFAFWAVIGVVIYYFALAILSMTLQATVFMNLLGFKGSDKRTIILLSAEKLAIRTAGIFGLALFVVFANKLLIPVILTLAAASLSGSIYLGAIYLVSSLVFTAVSIHVIVVLLRVIALRSRLVSWMFEPADAR